MSPSKQTETQGNSRFKRPKLTDQSDPYASTAYVTGTVAKKHG